MNPRVLMFGWEFPPFKSGGLGTACRDLTKGLSKLGTKVTFVMPVKPEGAKSKHAKLIGALTGIKIKKIDSLLTAYMTSEQYETTYYNTDHKKNRKEVYGRNLFQEVKRYAIAAKQIARNEKHDIIHVHDWMTYEAGIHAKKISKKPLVAHIHATEFDRTGGNPNPHISHVEYQGLQAADRIIANSNYTKQNVMTTYNIPENKIDVVHWGIDDFKKTNYRTPISDRDKIVLFLGRITLQKGPDYFVEAAAKVLKFEPNTTFVIVGEGDMMPHIINKAAESGISNKVVFTGKLNGQAVYDAFHAADLYVMPSVSEPFGLVALESIKNGTPVLISKQSGVKEVVKNALTVDFWDIDSMTNQIVSVLRHTPLREELQQNSMKEVSQYNIIEPARKVLETYKVIT